MRRQDLGSAPSRVNRVLVGLALVALFAGCTSAPLIPGGASACEQTCLAGRLQAAGATVSGGDRLSDAAALWVNAQGYVYTVNGEQMTVYVFADSGAARAAASEVKDGGSEIVRGGPLGGTALMVDWVAPPHFYRVGEVIAIYVGAKSQTLAVLRRVIRFRCGML
jgi:hypothetical protein